MLRHHGLRAPLGPSPAAETAVQQQLRTETRRDVTRCFDLRGDEAPMSRSEPELYLFERRQLGRVLNVSQAGALSRQLLRDPLELRMLRRQDQAGMVAQLPQVLQRLRGRRRDRGSKNGTLESAEHPNVSIQPSRREPHLENVSRGFEFRLLLLLCGGRGDALVHAGFGPRLRKVFVQLDLQAFVTHIKSSK